MPDNRRKNLTRRRRPAPKQKLVVIALKAGAFAAKVIDPSTIETAAWVRWKCQFGCGCYGSSLVCPPYSPAPDQTRQMLDGYRRAIFFESPPGRAKSIAVEVERALFLSGHYKAIGLGAGPCELCRVCAFDKGCRHADQARPAMEACGIDVFATARKHGFKIDVVRSPSDPQHYFGVVLVE
jgi:predicted metal-binding protein